MYPRAGDFYSQCKKAAFLLNEIALYKLTNRGKLKILFSKAPVQEDNLRKGLRFTNVEFDFAEFTEEIIPNYDLVVPLTIPDVKKLNELRHLVKSDKIPIPTLESINICDDKYLFYQTLKHHGYEYLLPKIDTNLPFTYILKKKITERGVDNYVIANEETQKKYQDLIDSPDYFCQEMVLGKKEYATHILIRDKKIVASLNIEYIFSNIVPIKGQDEIAARNIVPSPFNDIFADILNAIGFEGICCFNYKEVDGNPMIIEINPRFGASLSLYFVSFLRKLL